MWLVITHSAEARKRHDLRRLRGGRKERRDGGMGEGAIVLSVVGTVVFWYWEVSIG
jgi:hypothetical protein